MDPKLLCELVAALMFEYLHRAGLALADKYPGTDPRVEHYQGLLFPVWHDMMTELQLPLEPPNQTEDTEVRLLELADFLRESAQEIAVQGELDQGLDEPTGTMN